MVNHSISFGECELCGARVKAGQKHALACANAPTLPVRLEVSGRHGIALADENGNYWGTADSSPDDSGPRFAAELVRRYNAHEARVAALIGLVASATLIEERWESGDIADAFRTLVLNRDIALSAIASAKGGAR